MEARSCNICYSGNAVIFTYYECVFVAFGTQLEMRICHLSICGLPGFTVIFSHYLINGAIIEKKIIEYKTYVVIFSTTFV